MPSGVCPVARITHSRGCARRRWATSSPPSRATRRGWSSTTGAPPPPSLLSAPTTAASGCVWAIPVGDGAGRAFLATARVGRAPIRDTLRRAHELAHRALDPVAQQLDVGDRVVVAGHAERKPTVVGEDRHPDAHMAPKVAR